MTLTSMKEWLASWGDGANWSDQSGATIPISKESLGKLIADAERMRDALRGLKERALNHAPGVNREFTPGTAASLAHICEDALEGVE